MFSYIFTRCSSKTALKAFYVTSSNARVDLPCPKVSSKIAAFKKGTGGRCSFSGNVVTVFGATGLLGSAVVNRLARDGHQIIIPHRQEPYYTREFRVFGEYGQIILLPFQLKDEKSIREGIKYSNVVINMIGTKYPTTKYSLEETNVTGARRIARICKEMGIEKLIHVSALNATKNPPPTLLNKPSEFLKTKAFGEDAVLEEFPNATVVRPSVMYGSEPDYFVTLYLSLWRLPNLSRVHVYKKGEHTYKMPVYFGDVAHGLQKLVTDLNADGKIYEFVGPHCYKLSELVDYMFERAHLSKRFRKPYRRIGHSLPFKAYVGVMQLCNRLFKASPPINYEWLRFVEGTNDVLTGCPTLPDVGVTRLTEFELTGGVRSYLSVRRFDEAEPDPREPYLLPLRSPPLRSNVKQDSGIVTESKLFQMNAA